MECIDEVTGLVGDITVLPAMFVVTDGKYAYTCHDTYEAALSSLLDLSEKQTTGLIFAIEEL